MDNPGNLYGRVHPDNFPNENDYRNPVIADAMKTLGYANQFSRGINMVQEQLEENNNGLAVFDFNDITTFRVTVANADLNLDEGETGEVENEAENEVEDGAINKAENEVNKVQNEVEDEVEDEVEAGNEVKGEVEDEVKSEAEKIPLRQTMILELIRVAGSLSMEAISKQLKISVSSVYRDIEKLKKDGKLERVGGDKNGYWKIK
jgi:ATP-dependent DNA helicase RecG